MRHPPHLSHGYTLLGLLGLASAAAFPLAAACSPSSDTAAADPGALGNGSGAATGSGGSTGTGAGTGTGGVALNVVDLPVGPNADAACSAVSDQAEVIGGGLADVIFVLDNSGSMTEEAAAVQNNMNRFSQMVTGVDLHVVVISSGPPPTTTCTNPLDPACYTGFGNSNGVCIEPPLGLAGACPNGDDTNIPAGYMHWRVPVDSHNALSQIMNTYTGGWDVMIRPNSAKTFVVVTDDNANATPTPADFTNWVNSQAAFSTSLWRFSGIFCETMSANCAAQGTTYSALVTQTGGVVGDMALFSSGTVDAEFQKVFDSLAQAVARDAAPIDCAWNIPPPPNGQTLDPNSVNVQFTSGNGQSQLIYGVNAASDCDAAGGGWYYDDAVHPSLVLACPSTCQMMQADLQGRVDVLFGCARQVPPLQ